MKDKYTAVWVSHSSIGDFIKCPRLYYLHNVYKDPVTKKKISIVSPHMSLGIAVHEVLEGLGDFSSETRMQKDLLTWFDDVWKKVSGQKGAFKDEQEENEFKARGVAMLNNVKKDPKFLINKRIKLPREVMNPNFFLSEKDNIILNGLVDWIEYLPESDSLHIIDFKTGKKEESESSLQLPIYLLLCNALQKRAVTRASYWYLESGNVIEKELPNKEEAYEAVMAVAKKVKDARVKNIFDCPNGNYNKETGDGGCFGCRVYEKILLHDPSIVYVGEGMFNQNMYIEKRD